MGAWGRLHVSGGATGGGPWRFRTAEKIVSQTVTVRDLAEMRLFLLELGSSWYLFWCVS